MRKEDLKKYYREQFIKRNPKVSDELIKVWNSGFDSGYKARKRRMLAHLGEIKK